MKKLTILALFCAVMALAPALSAAEDFLLYAPKPAVGNQVPASPSEGVLVKTVIVKHGDTLKKLSRQHIGVASYFPQVLVFNTIKNPDLIHPGDKLLVPVRPGHAVSAKKSTKSKKHHAARRHVRHEAAAKPSKVEPAPSAVDEQESYQQAKRAYLKGQYQKSLELFDTFLRRFPKSDLAADASLYRADCLLRLSGQ